MGSRLAACLWIYTTAVSGAHARKPEMEAIMESGSWVREDAMEDHEWVRKLVVTLIENEILVALSYDIGVPCVIEWDCCGSRHLHE